MLQRPFEFELGGNIDGGHAGRVGPQQGRKSFTRLSEFLPERGRFGESFPPQRLAAGDRLGQFAQAETVQSLQHHAIEGGRKLQWLSQRKLWAIQFGGSGGTRGSQSHQSPGHHQHPGPKEARLFPSPGWCWRLNRYRQHGRNLRSEEWSQWPRRSRSSRAESTDNVSSLRARPNLTDNPDG